MSDPIFYVRLTVEEVRELLYWHSRVPDYGDPDQPEMEALRKKLRDLLPEEGR